MSVSEIFLRNPLSVTKTILRNTGEKWDNCQDMARKRRASARVASGFFSFQLS